MFAQDVVPVVVSFGTYFRREGLWAGETYHSVSAFGSSIGTATRSSIGAAILRFLIYQRILVVALTS